MAIRNIYLWEGIVSIAPLVVPGTLVLTVGAALISILELDPVRDSWCSKRVAFFGDDSICTVIVKVFFRRILGILMSILGVALTFLMTFMMGLSFIFAAIPGTLWTLFVFEVLSNETRFRLSHNYNKFYHDNLDWIVTKSNTFQDEKGNTILTKKQHKMVKLCVMNRAILKHHPLISLDEEERNKFPQWPRPWRNYYDTGLAQYLYNQERHNFKQASLKGMRKSCTLCTKKPYNNRNANPFREFGAEYYFKWLNEIIVKFKGADGMEKCLYGLGVMAIGFVNYVSEPIYFLSKIFNLLMPFIVVLYIGIA